MSAKSRSTSPRGRLLVGSSIRTTRARVAMARQISTTWRAPIGSRPTTASGSMSGWPNSASTSRVGCRARSRSHSAAPRRLGAHQHVLGHREVREQRQLLVDERDAARRARRAASAARRPRRPPRCVPASGRCEPAQDGEQRALAGAVLAEERVHLARLHLERRAVERERRAEALRDAGEAQDGRHSPGFEVLVERRLEQRLHLRGVEVRGRHDRDAGVDQLRAPACPAGGRRAPRPRAPTCGTGSAARSPASAPCAWRPRRPGSSRSRRT